MSEVKFFAKCKGCGKPLKLTDTVMMGRMDKVDEVWCKDCGLRLKRLPDSQEGTGSSA